MPTRSVLIVDDEPLITRTLVRLLRGHEVVAVSSVKEAALAAAGRVFDIAIFDLNLRDGSGFDASRHVKASRRVLMSGSCPLELADPSLLENFQWLAKPFRRESLDALLTDLE